MIIIYILALENDKFYIGKTSNIDFRLQFHFDTNKSLWTKRYNPLKIIELINDCDNFDEDKYTIMYMAKYGIDNVRGRTYCQIKLEEWQIKNIEAQICTAYDKYYEYDRNEIKTNDKKSHIESSNEYEKLLKTKIIEAYLLTEIQYDVLWYKYLHNKKINISIPFPYPKNMVITKLIDNIKKSENPIYILSEKELAKFTIDKLLK